MTVDISAPQSAQQSDDSVWGELLFTYADEEIDHGPDIYLKLQTPHRERPKRPVWKQLHSLRPELESLRASSHSEKLDKARTDLARRGFAAIPHHSQVLAERGLDTQHGYSLFIKENQEYV